MCGIVGIVGKSPVNQNIYNALTVLQHRGQDAAGITTVDEDGNFRTRKANGLVREVFNQEHMIRLEGTTGIGHVRYPTAGGTSVFEAQPFEVNSPYGISLSHNGNLTNQKELKEKLFEEARRHVNTNSDSEVLLNIFAYHLEKSKSKVVEPEEIFSAIENIHKDVKGAYACVIMILGFGLVAFRDPFGIRPLVYGERMVNGNKEYMFASETVALDMCGFKFVRDLEPGEAICVKDNGELISKQCSENPILAPCLFEYVYLARPDSFIEKVSVYASRVNMGEFLGKKIKREYSDLEIDVVIPIPETSNDIALHIANILEKPYRQGFVKNRYIGRTFIMPGQEERRLSVRRKLNPIRSEFVNKNVLLVDDSIVRGTTSQQIVEMIKDMGAKKVYIASAAPEVRFPNVYGIDMPSVDELIAHDKTVEEIEKEIGVDRIIFQDLEDLKSSIKLENSDIKEFDDSVFSGKYITGNVSKEYLEQVSHLRKDSSKK